MEKKINIVQNLMGNDLIFNFMGVFTKRDILY